MKKLSGNKLWIENRKTRLKLLKNIKITRKTDRLEILRDWITVHNTLSESLMGWSQWLNSIRILEKIDRDSLKKLFENYKELVEAFVEFDIQGTKLIDEKLSKTRERKEIKLPEYAV